MYFPPGHSVSSRLRLKMNPKEFRINENAFVIKLKNKRVEVALHNHILH